MSTLRDQPCCSLVYCEQSFNLGPEVCMNLERQLALILRMRYIEGMGVQIFQIGIGLKLLIVG